MQIVYRGSVNRWECDENDHLNVRFYLAKHMQILSAGMLAHGVADKDNLSKVVGLVESQHLRFLQESRLSAPLSGYFGFCIDSEQSVVAFTELRHSLSDEVLCTCVHAFSPAYDLTQAVSPTSIPPYGAPRGLAQPVARQILASQSVEGFAERGFALLGAGLVEDHEVDANNVMHLQHYIGRLSDGMPHLWMNLRGADENANPEEGGAVLEYRLQYVQRLTLQDRFSIWSGVVDVQPKTQRFVHLVVDPADLAIRAIGETVGVRMDLSARKALRFDDAELAKMRTHVIQI